MKDTQPVDTIAGWRQEVKMSQLTPVLHNCETNNHFLELNILLYTICNINKSLTLEPVGIWGRAGAPGHRKVWIRH